MTPKTAGWDELHLSENPAVELLESLGYTYAPPEDLEPERSSLKETILTNRLAAALKRLNPWLSDTNVTKAVKAVTQVPAASLAEANETLYTSLTYGIALEQDRGDGRKSHTVRFLDFENPDNNEWIVTRQYRVLGSKKHIIPDVVALVNGLPLAVIECKSPTKGDGWKSEAVQQLHRYQELGTRWKNQGAPKLFGAAQILVGTCGERAVYGTVGTPERFFLEWKEPYPLTVKQLEDQLGRPPKPQDILLYGLLRRRNLLDIMRNFVAFEVEGGRTVRKLTRYRQFIAVNEAMRRIRTANKPSARGGIVWHTQGSGKSLTMLWLALKLRRDPSQQQPTIVIVTDRTKLDKQIAGVFTACGFPNPEQADSVRGLRRILEHPTGKTVMTTIQKFQEITGSNPTPRDRSVHPTLSEANNIFVMVDEAHRTQYRSLAANMRQALPNACFLGFTGTPIDKKDRSTLRTFGPYIDTYTIEQAVHDKATVPIFYESRLPELQIIGQTIDKVFDHVFADRSEDERAIIKQRYATEQAIAAAPRRIEAICLDLIEHFTKFIAPNGLKAHVVATSRHAAVTYKETLDRLNGPESAVIMSAGHNDEERLARWHLRKEEQDRLIERFQDQKDPLSILVVCDMLLTGFDAPVEQVMYLDAPLREHSLLQAIARVNRPHGDEKTYGLVVDYWGVSVKLSRSARRVFDDRRSGRTHAQRGRASSACRAATQRRCDSSSRSRTRTTSMPAWACWSPRTSAPSSTSPSAVSASPWTCCFRTCGPCPIRPTSAGWARSGEPRAPRYRDDQLDLSGCGEKVRKLIADAVAADGIEILVKEVQLFSPEFDEKIEALKTDDAKASEMEHAIRHEINIRVEENPVFYQSLRERLEEIIEQHRLERLDAAEQLKLFQRTSGKSFRGSSPGRRTLGSRRAATPSTAFWSRHGQRWLRNPPLPMAPPTATWHPSSTSRSTPSHGARGLVGEGRRAAADAQQDQAPPARQWNGVRFRGASRLGHPGSHQGADGPMTPVETSAVTWGGTELPYTIRRSPRRKKTVAVTVDPSGDILVVAPERVATKRLDAIVSRKAEWLTRRIRRAGGHGPPLSPREFVSGESVLYLGRHYRLKVDPDATGKGEATGRMASRARGRRRPGAGGRPYRTRRVVPPAGGGAVTGTRRGVACKGRRPDAARQAGEPAEALGQL